MNLLEIIQQLEWCEYDNEAGSLTSNIAWRALRDLAGLPTRRSPLYVDGRGFVRYEIDDTNIKLPVRLVDEGFEFVIKHPATRRQVGNTIVVTLADLQDLIVRQVDKGA